MYFPELYNRNNKQGNCVLLVLLLSIIKAKNVAVQNPELFQKYFLDNEFTKFINILNKRANIMTLNELVLQLYYKH